jgi:hypothetical protein
MKRDIMSYKEVATSKEIPLHAMDGALAKRRYSP